MIKRALGVTIALPVIYAALATYAERPQLSPAVFALRDARVVVEPGRVLSRATVVIRDGLIEQNRHHHSHGRHYGVFFVFFVGRAV